MNTINVKTINFVTPEPHYISGYTGYCPQFKYRMGSTYGQLTNKLLIDPTVKHSKNSVIPKEIKRSNYKLKRFDFGDIDLVKSGKKEKVASTNPMKSEFNDASASLCKKCGCQYQIRNTVTASEELDQSFQIVGKLQESGVRSLGDLRYLKNDYCLPLSAVRPETTRYIPTEFSPDKIPSQPGPFYKKYPAPHQLTNNNPQNYLIKEYTGDRLLFEFPEFGTSRKLELQCTLKDLTNQQNFRRSYDRSPVPFYHSSLNAEQAGSEIYPRACGIIPTYQGHVPGMKHSYGRTFGTESINAKRHLQQGMCIH